MSARGTAWNTQLFLSSLFCATLAFNFTFFLQELFLVIAKALVPGVHATLYHNNHSWTGHAAILPLLQGTGALADLTVGVLFFWLSARTASRSTTIRLLLFWMAFQGLFQGLSQFVIGALMPANDVGVAMTYLGLSANERILAALLALLIMLWAGYGLARNLIRMLGTARETATAKARMGFVLRLVALPALFSVLLLIPFREPRNIVEVAVLPLIVMVAGLLGTQGLAWLAPPATRTARPLPGLLMPILGLLLVLAVFQLVLRPGIAFS